jgi:GNAT superfamily N-acetyltransferase
MVRQSHPQIFIRLAQSSDHAAISAILEEARQWLIQRGIPDQWPTPMPDPVLAERIAGHQVYVAHINDHYIGTFSLFWSDPEVWGAQPDNAGYLHGLAIRRSVANKGIGVYLIDAASRLVATTGRVYLRLDCWAGNPGLMQYYAGLGFRPCGTRTWQATRERRAVTVQRYERPVGT